jgi:phospholipid/cholesterol/gamma-HCH transport system permease protein
MTLTFVKLVPMKVRFRSVDLLVFIQQHGAQALPIVTLISFLVGVILAFIGAVQLQRFGAQIYVADLVAIAIVREMGAVMTGIIMAGRTGAAFAAQLGTMKVTQEIDAFTTIGLPPQEFLVLPRVIALVLMMPLLCVYADCIGVLGGAAVGIGMLDISWTTYFRETLHAISLTDLFGGLFKEYGLRGADRSLRLPAGAPVRQELLSSGRRSHFRSGHRNRRHCRDMRDFCRRVLCAGDLTLENSKLEIRNSK